MHILLVEPNYPLRYPNLALMKLSAKYKKEGATVEYTKGNQYFIKKPDKIFISTLFTYYSEETIRCINFYKHFFKEAEIEVGGIFATLMPDYIKEKTGITPIIGCSDELDRLTPDYEIVKEMIRYSPYIKKWEDFSILFSTRGCIRKCPFCAVHILEPEHKILPNWKELINLKKKHIMVQDNNITSFPIEHFSNVLNYIIDHKLSACFNNGFDCRLMTEKHMQLMSKVKWYPGGLRLAFDNMSEDKYIQKSVKRLLELGVSKSAFLIFCMFNFKDDLDEAMYRLSEMRELGVRPYPQVYAPLDKLTKKPIFVSDKWTLELIREVRQYWILAGNFKYKTFEEFLTEKGKTLSELMVK